MTELKKITKLTKSQSCWGKDFELKIQFIFFLLDCVCTVTAEMKAQETTLFRSCEHVQRDAKDGSLHHYTVKKGGLFMRAEPLTYLKTAPTPYYLKSTES